MIVQWLSGKFLLLFKTLSRAQRMDLSLYWVGFSLLWWNRPLYKRMTGLGAPRIEKDRCNRVGCRQGSMIIIYSWNRTIDLADNLPSVVNQKKALVPCIWWIWMGPTKPPDTTLWASISARYRSRFLSNCLGKPDWNALDNQEAVEAPRDSGTKTPFPVRAAPFRTDRDTEEWSSWLGIQCMIRENDKRTKRLWSTDRVTSAFMLLTTTE